MVDAVVLRGLPFDEGDGLVAVGERRPVGPRPDPNRDPDAVGSASAQNFLDWMAEQQVFESMAATAAGTLTLRDPGAPPEELLGQRVTAGFFQVLRVQPAIGRAFRAENEVEGQHRVVVLSHALWQRRFGKDPTVVGRTSPLDQHVYEIVGVMPARRIAVRLQERVESLDVMNPDLRAAMRELGEYAKAAAPRSGKCWRCRYRRPGCRRPPRPPARDAPAGSTRRRAEICARARHLSAPDDARAIPTVIQRAWQAYRVRRHRVGVARAARGRSSAVAISMLDHEQKHRPRLTRSTMRCTRVVPMDTPRSMRAVRFGPFHVDPRTRELRKGGSRIRIPEQSVRILLALLERSGEVVTRDELVARLWSTETEVDVEHGLNSAVRRLRDALGDSAERPVFVETVPRIGYRFVGAVDAPAHLVPDSPQAAEIAAAGTPQVPRTQPEPPTVPVATGAVRRWRLLSATVLFIVAVASIGVWPERQTKEEADVSHPEPIPLTFEGGLQTDPSISPDGQWIAYASDSGGNFDVWVRRLSGGDPVRVTHDKAADYQPDWSPDGGRLVFRSERAGGGLFVTALTGGTAQRISNSGFRPRWSPDGRQILFAERALTGLNLGLRVIDLDGRPMHTWPGRAVGAFGWQPNSSIVLELASLFGPFEPTLVSWPLGASSVDSWVVPGIVTREFRAQQLVVIGGQELLVSPDKSFLYFVGSSRGRRALWRLDIDPAARRVTAGPRRITALPDANNATLAPDGSRVVFDGSTRHAQLVSYPLERDGRLAAEPSGVTSEAVDAISPGLSRDGRALAFVLTLPGSPERSELTARLRGQSRDHTVRVIDHPREVVTMPRWNDTGTKLAYSLVVSANEASAQQQVRVFDALTGDDVPLTSAHSPVDMMEFPTGWTPDGRQVILTSWHYGTGNKTIAQVSIDKAPSAERSRHVITASADVGISLGAMSPDHRWVAFRVGELEGLAPRIAVVPATGGSSATWTFITSGVEPADKPSWSDDGATLYFTSGNDTLNVLGIRFDTRQGRPMGEPFNLTNFRGPGEHVHSDLRTLELGSGGRRLVVPIVRPKGGLWTMELARP